MLGEIILKTFLQLLIVIDLLIKWSKAMKPKVLDYKNQKLSLKRQILVSK